MRKNLKEARQKAGMTQKQIYGLRCLRQMDYLSL